jgi:hypothetical protein
LCELELGVSTERDVHAVLGRETGSTRTAFTTHLSYFYGDEADVVLLLLEFDENDVFIDATTMGIPHPSCWTGWAGSERRAAFRSSSM